MIRLLRALTISALVFSSSLSLASPFAVRTTSQGTEYGLMGLGLGAWGVGKRKPLALIFTTSIQASLEDEFTNLGGKLLKAGFLVASLDVPCHGKDVRSNEDGGLECWRKRIESGETRVFEHFSRKVSNVVSDLISNNLVDSRSVVVIGVSRGGYVALQAAAFDPNIKYVAILSPVTNLQRLSEFHGLAVDQMRLGFVPKYKQLAQKKIFLQIGNNDDRVGTDDSLKLSQGVVASDSSRLVDFSTYVMPFTGHAIAKDDLAIDWIFRKIRLPLGAASTHTKSAP